MPSRNSLDGSSQASISPVTPITVSSVNSVPVLVDFLNSVPAPLTTVLVELAPFISSIRHAAEIVSWKSSWDESWLALAAWWAVCLLADGALRYLLPIAILFTLAVRHWTSSPHFVPPPVTEHNLQTTISDLTTIHSLLFSPFPSSFSLPSPPVLLRTSAILYTPYLLLTYFVRLRVLLAISGTLFLTWRAPWAGTARRVLWRSAYIRWSLYRIWALLSGEPILQTPRSALLSPLSLFPPREPDAPPPTSTIRFLFTVYENQRWWMGLDWTAALLPGERPSWCSAAQHAVAPPSAFALPAPTTVFLADAHGTRMKRSATWKWEEGEWRVLVKREQDGGVSRVERSLPSAADEAGAATGAGTMILKAAGRMRSATSAGEGTSTEDRERSVDESGAVNDEGASEEPSTDSDGWVYGDNKWESASCKGGIGKYTRYRRWTRIAVLSETVEPVEAGDVGILREDAVSTSSTSSATTSSTVVPSIPDSPGEESPTRGSMSQEGNRLRQRLRAIAVGATAHS